MAEDIWTIHLECEWAAPGQKHVTREMDKDEICFLNLIEFVEEYGYTSIDYLYYKRTDGLVPIQLDNDVTEMLKEHDIEKEVSLFMTKRRIATMVPSKSNKAPAKSAPKNTKGQKGTKKKSHLNIIQTEAHYANDIEQQQDDDIQGTPGGCQEVGKRKGTVLTHVWNLQAGKRIVEKCSQLGQPIGKEEKVLVSSFMLCPDDVDQDQWNNIIKYWKSRDGKARSEKNKTAREMRKSTHPAGAKSYARWFEDLGQADPAKRQPHRAEVYLATHRNRVQGTNDAAANLVSTDHGKFQKHVVHSKRKRVQCAVPNRGHAFGKERDELNKHTCDTEYSDNDDDIFLSNEKCLDDPCQADPNYKELSQEAAEPTSSECSINQSKQKEFQVHQRSSSDGLKKRKVIKNQQGVLQETAAMTQQNVTRDNAANLKGSKYMQPSIKVSSTVVLKSSNHRNKAIVAYATFLSSSPKANVGGVEIGKQFYKVRINHPIVQDEPLVRPIPGCKTIGDAHAKGLPIAWPSICVEMING
ncbi:unnamed protein product [Urochloa decumbens]|uniref:Transposase Tnp1/En/Spm-like domain-containing protein n=1 Tax=Urochloa decumbens TaxID=240449 RepID=A0ABC8YV20_9POAL